MALKGEVTPRSFDKGIVDHLGAYLGSVKDPDGNDVPTYLIDIDGVEGPIQVMFNNPNARLVKEKIPYLNIQIDYPEEALERMQGPLALDYSEYDEETGERCERLLPMPYDIRYTFNAFLRKHSEYNSVLMFYLKKFPKLSTIAIKDSKGDRRVYPFKSEGGGDITDVVDSAERYPAISHTIKVEGELELTNEVCSPTVGPTGETTVALQPQEFSEIFYRNALVVQKNVDGSIRFDINGDPVYLETEIVYFNPLDTPHDGDSELQTVEVFVIQVDTNGDPIRDGNNNIVFSPMEVLVLCQNGTQNIDGDGNVICETFTGMKVNSDDTQILDENNNVIQKDFDIMLLNPNENGTWTQQTVTMGVEINLNVKDC